MTVQEQNDKRLKSKVSSIKIANTKYNKKASARRTVV